MLTKWAYSYNSGPARGFFTTVSANYYNFHAYSLPDKHETVTIINSKRLSFSPQVYQME